jgi:RNA polymerase sigma-70 factor (ECF subfamily)
VRLEAEDWDRLPGRFGLEPARESEWRDLLAALRRAVDTELTARQREVFVAIVVHGVRWTRWRSGLAPAATRCRR